jgi:dephospho-CoA kinase
MAQRRLILITGMTGSGKTTLSGIIRETGLKVVTMGDVIRDLAYQQ